MKVLVPPRYLLAFCSSQLMIRFPPTPHTIHRLHMSARRYSSDKTRGQNVRCHRSGLLACKKADFKKHPFGRCGCHDIPHGYPAPFISPTELKTPCNPGCCILLWQRYSLGMGCLNDDKWWSMWAWSLRYFSYHEFRSSNCVFGTRVAHVRFLSQCLFNCKPTVP